MIILFAYSLFVADAARRKRVLPTGGRPTPGVGILGAFFALRSSAFSQPATAPDGMFRGLYPRGSKRVMVCLLGLNDD